MRVELMPDSGGRRRRRRRPRRATVYASSGYGGGSGRRRGGGFRLTAVLAWLGGLLAVVLVAAVVLGVLGLTRSTPRPRLTPALPSGAGSAAAGDPPLAWPAQGGAAVALAGPLGAGGAGVESLLAHGSQRPSAIASVAKIMTATVVLADHPLRGGASGPSVTVTPADVRVFHADVAAGQSVLAVRAGERLTERQLLEGLLLPSGNNVATLLAGWDAGSQAAFVRRMNATARRDGLTGTRYTGASGVQSATVSTASDQVRLAVRAMRIPAFREIVGLAQATLPVAGRVFNVDALLGHDGIVGIKTGTTSTAGGCFVFAARRRVGGRTVTVVGAVLHQLPSTSDPSIITAAFRGTTRLLRSVPRSLRTVLAVRRGETLGRLTVPWHGLVALRATRTVTALGWRGERASITFLAGRVPRLPLAAGAPAGAAIVRLGGTRTVVGLRAAAAVPAAPLTWRLKHP